LSRAVAGVPANGGTVRIRQAEYPALAIDRRSYTRSLRFVAADGEHPTLTGATLTDAHGIRFERLRIAATVNIASSTDVDLVQNQLDVAVSTAINLSLGAARVTVSGNTIHAETGTGLNIGGSGTAPPVSDVVIRDNHFDGIGRDAMQLKRFARVVVEGNEIEGVYRSDPTFHPDVIQTYDGGDGLLISRNFIHDNECGILVKDGRVTGLRIVNNVMVRLDGTGYALQLFDAPGAVLANNTLWSRSPVILRGPLLEDNKAILFNNVFEALTVTDTALIGYADYNAVAGGSLLSSLAPHSVMISKGSTTVLDSTSLAPADASPLIDAGTSLDAPDVDLGGRVRRAVSTGALGSPDIGALEYVPSGGFPVEPKPPVETPTPTPTPTDTTGPTPTPSPVVTPEPSTVPHPSSTPTHAEGGASSSTPSGNSSAINAVGDGTKRAFKVTASVLRWTKRKLTVSVRCSETCRAGVRFKTSRARAARFHTFAIRRGGVRVISVRTPAKLRCKGGATRCRLRADLVVFARSGPRRHVRLQRRWR
jgi:hypothetical protein